MLSELPIYIYVESIAPIPVRETILTIKQILACRPHFLFSTERDLHLYESSEIVCDLANGSV